MPPLEVVRLLRAALLVQELPEKLAFAPDVDVAAHDPHSLPIWEYYRQIFWSSGVDLPDDSLERMIGDVTLDTLELPGGWSTSGDASWSVVDNPARAYGTGRYEAKAGTITHNQETRLRSPTIHVSCLGKQMHDGSKCLVIFPYDMPSIFWVYGDGQ